MKTLFALTLISISFSSLANNRDLSQRVRHLEEAVRDLQDARPRTMIRTIHVCVMQTSFDGAFIGKGSTKLEAATIAQQKCDESNASFCSSSTNKMSCDLSREEVIIR